MRWIKLISFESVCQMNQASVLMVDLNNFAHYPTIPVGSLIAALRAGGHSIRLFSPSAIGISGFARQARARKGEHFIDQLRFWSALTHRKFVRHGRDRLRNALTPRSDSVRQRIVSGFIGAMADRPDVVLISAYTIYHAAVRDIARVCSERGVPLIIGGPYFNEPSVARHWLALDGVSAVVAGEAEPFIADMVTAAASGSSLSNFPGTYTDLESLQRPAAPLVPLSRTPIPDYRDFPWHTYPIPIVPVMTSRGCSWGVCQFCSDVTTVMGRSFRSHKLQRVIEEIGTLTERHQARHMVFHDLKLNSDLKIWYGLIDGMPQLVKDAVWTCAVHAGNEDDNGLGPDALKAARAAGLARMTTGLESGSQRMLNAMGKGTRVDRIAALCRDASEAGISVRLTVIVGFPGETVPDLRKTADFLEANGAHIERVMVNRFALMMGTPIAHRILSEPRRFPSVEGSEPDLNEAIMLHQNAATREKGYYRALFSVLRAAQRINRQPLRSSAMAFEGVM